MRKLKWPVLALLAVLVPVAVRGAEGLDFKQQVFEAESTFAQSLEARDFAAFSSHVSPEAVFFGGRTLRGKEAVVGAWKKFFDGAKPPFSWKPEVIEVLPSGSLALSSGPVFDPAGKKIATFSSIWRRDKDGQWRIIFDKGCSECDTTRTK